MKRINNLTKFLIYFRSCLTFLLAFWCLGFAPQAFSKDWKKAISQFQVQNFNVPLKELDSLSAPESKKKIYNDYLKFIIKLSEDYKSSLGVDYTPFIGAFQQTAIKDFIDKFETIDNNAVAAIVDKVNSSVKYDFFYFKEYDFGLSMHQLYDLKAVTQSQKNDITRLNYQVLKFQKDLLLLKIISVCSIFLALFLLFSLQKMKSYPTPSKSSKTKI